MRRFLAVWIGMIAVLALLDGATASPAQADGPLALAFYYAWFDENTWTPDKTPDFPTPRYVSRDRGTIERHVSQAQGAGIDALVQSWWGPGNPTEDNFRTLLDVAKAKGFRAAVDFELTSPMYGGNRGAIVNGLRHLIQNHTGHPAYLRWNGKPVIFFWRQNMFGVNEWAAIRNEVDPNRTTIWIAEGVDAGYLAQFDGHHLYSVAWDANPAAQLIKWGNNVRAAEQKWGDKLWVATAMPGYDDTRLAGQRSGVFKRDRANGAYYRETFRGAVESAADWVIITSFNEWPEGTYIEPSEAYGDFYLKLTGELVRGWKSGAPAVEAPSNAVPPKPGAVTAGVDFIGEGERRQVLQFNPQAALQKRIFADRFVPNSPEFSVTVAGTTYASQRAENLANGVVRVYFVQVGDWGNVNYVEGAGAGDPLRVALLAEAQKRQVIQYNPNAALQKRIFADGFVPNSTEFNQEASGATHIAQRAENLNTGQVRVYHVRTGDWGNVQFVIRP